MILMSRRLQIFFVVVVSVCAVSVVWGTSDDGLTRSEENVPWRWVAITAVGLLGVGFWKWADNLSKTLQLHADELKAHRDDLLEIKTHLGLRHNKESN